MKVLNLRCANGHAFEGWFDSEDDFLSQNGAQRIECPLCADRVIVKTPSAPRLNLGHASEVAKRAEPGQGEVAIRPATDAVPMPEQMQALWMQAVRRVLAHTEDVGPRFAEEARKIHYGESKERGIRGQASAEEREALLDEGIEIAALPIPAALKGSLQ